MEELTVGPVVVLDDGRCVYHLTDIGWHAPSSVAGGTIAKMVGRDGIVVTMSGPVESLTFGYERPRIVGWSLIDPANESMAYPLTLTVDEMVERRAKADSDDPVFAWYRSLSEKGAEKITVDVSDAQVIPVEWSDPPELSNGQIWKPNGAMLQQWGGTIADHLLPGSLSGLAEAIIDAYMDHPWRAPGLMYRDDRPLVERDGSARLGYRVPWTPPRVEKSKQGRKIVQREVFSHWEWKGKLPTGGVTGPNLDAALLRFNQLFDKWVDLTSPPDALKCSACGGTGMVFASD